ncbi:hypothetical protein TU76_08995 [Pseudomonas psychrophila]|nr:hypothetical protein TU76_08995 [Pseudomonas psychrophila]KOX62994.1 hypothetical protein AA303_21485 [Pseudomonas psychrophila]
MVTHSFLDLLSAERRIDRQSCVQLPRCVQHRGSGPLFFLGAIKLSQVAVARPMSFYQLLLG